MNLRDLSIRTRLYLLLVVTVIFWLLTGFIVLSLTDRIERYRSAADRINTIPGLIRKLELSINSFYLYDLSSSRFHENGQSESIQQFNRNYLSLYTAVSKLKQSRILKKDLPEIQEFENMTGDLNKLNDNVEKLVEDARERGWDNYGFCGSVQESLDNFASTFAHGNNEDLNSLLTGSKVYFSYPSPVIRNDLLSVVNRVDSQITDSGNLHGISDNEILMITNILKNLRLLIRMDSEIGASKFEGLQGEIFRSLGALDQQAGSIGNHFTSLHLSKKRQFNLLILLTILLAAAVYAVTLSLINRYILHRLNVISDAASELEAGRYPEKVNINGDDEFSEISRRLNNFSESLKDKTDFAEKLSESEKREELVALSRDDRLALSLINLEKNLLSARREEEKHMKSREERRWVSEGIAKFGDILRIHNKDISVLAENVIAELVNYLEASAGGIFLITEMDDEDALELIASFAYDRKKYIKQKIKMGEGLVGTCAIEKEKIFISDIPDDYISITSGLGEGKPACLLLVPLQLEEVTLGVIELASIKILAGFEVEFVENLAESIASAVLTVQMNMRTAQLLEQSQAQAQEMKKQEETMRQNMEELRTTQEESARRESEISGILNAIHNSSHVAEFNMDEEVLSMNKKFLQLLQLQSQQVQGKKYHELIQVSRYTDEYKNFWAELRAGKTITRIDKVALLTGEDIWLRQTFTPILTPDGEIQKVLNIAADITETVEQRESLERQSNEITRANIEMKSFSDAVDKALIKCVYSSSGQITELNDNYEQVTGYTARELIGKNNRVFLQKVEKEQFDRIWDDILKDKSYSGVIRRTRPTGEEVWLMSTFTPVQDENGNIVKVIFLGQDITERKLKYQLLEEANREIERLRRQVDEQS